MVLVNMAAPDKSSLGAINGISTAIQFVLPPWYRYAQAEIITLGAWRAFSGHLSSVL